MVIKKAGTISGIDYVHERAEESRHKETLAYLMFMAGAIFFVGGVLETVITTENPDWFLFFPYKITPDPPNLLGLFMVLSGFMLLVLGIALGIHYVLEGSFYSDQLKKVYVTEKNRESKKLVVDRGARPFAKQLERAHTELGECKRHLMDHMGFNENDSMYYCGLLGDRWRELVMEEELYAHK
ncbi:MAG: hypothetical protein OEZ12_05235 [Candidatus Bathyarchaeota archaeon]|nr:hypothetical protein [Candidatus Bathyarchaeota archaeon]